MSTLILVRHGQASFAEMRYDALSEAGRAQARATGEWMRGREATMSRILCGPRQRHIDTAKLLLEGTGATAMAEVDEGLDEFAEGEDVLLAAAAMFGRPMMGPEAPPRSEALRAYDLACRAWAKGAVELPGRPRLGAFRRRVGNWLETLVGDADHAAGQRILAVTSAGVVGAVVCEVLGLPDERWHSLVTVIRNASRTELLFSPGRCSLSTFNCVAHLPDELISSI